MMIIPIRPSDPKLSPRTINSKPSTLSRTATAAWKALLALMIYKELQHTMPWLYMSRYYEQYNDEYVASLFNIRRRAEWTQWITYCLNGTILQAKDAVRRCHLFQEAKSEFHDQIGRPTRHTPVN